MIGDKLYLGLSLTRTSCDLSHRERLIIGRGIYVVLYWAPSKNTLILKIMSP